MVFLPSHPEPEEAENTLELNEEIHLKDEITFKYESEMMQDEEYPSSCPTTPFHPSTAHSTNRLSALELPVSRLVPVGSKSSVNTPPTIQQEIMSHATPEPTVLRSFNIPYSPQQQTDLRNPNTNPTPLILGRNNASQSFGTSTSLKTCQTVTVPAISSMGSAIMRQTTSNFTTTQPPSSMPIQRSEISSNIIINHGYGSSTQKTPLIPCHTKSSELGHGNIFNVIQSDKNGSDDTSFSFVPAQSVNNNNSTINTAASIIRQSRIQTHQIINNVASSEKFKPLTQAVYKNISISCILCSKVCPCPEALRLHLRADHPQTIYKCSHCLSEFKESDIIWHLLSDHKCRYCGIESDHKTSLIHHLKSTHKTDSSFTFYGNVYHFSPVVTKVNKRLVANYQCDGCGQFFRNVNTCKNHQQKGCTLFICALCDNYFVTIARLTAHMMTSHLKRYKCTFKGCHQDYAFQQSLKLHHNLYHSFPLHLR
jgi:DNA-directed RNA polymerase subunit RPC12/RpoP